MFKVNVYFMHDKNKISAVLGSWPQFHWQTWGRKWGGHSSLATNTQTHSSKNRKVMREKSIMVAAPQWTLIKSKTAYLCWQNQQLWSAAWTRTKHSAWRLRRTHWLTGSINAVLIGLHCNAWQKCCDRLLMIHFQSKEKGIITQMIENLWQAPFVVSVNVSRASLAKVLVGVVTWWSVIGVNAEPITMVSHKHILMDFPSLIQPLTTAGGWCRFHMARNAPVVTKLYNVQYKGEDYLGPNVSIHSITWSDSVLGLCLRINQCYLVPLNSLAQGDSMTCVAVWFCSWFWRATTMHLNKLNSLDRHAAQTKSQRRMDWLKYCQHGRLPMCVCFNTNTQQIASKQQSVPLTMCEQTSGL